MKVNHQWIEDLYWEENYDFLPIKGRQRGKRKQAEKNQTNPKKTPSKDPRVAEMISEAEELQEYRFSYNASRYERGWLLESLRPFRQDQWISDVLNLVKGGKEASVYLCAADPSSPRELIAAKVYRPRMFRNLKNDHHYRHGRIRLDQDGLEIVDERMEKAIQGRTDYGQKLLHTSWIEHEYRTLNILHKAGCDVPKPFASGNNAILMEFIGDHRVAAPTLNNIRLDHQEAKRLFQRTLHNIDLMLAHERVHADLSAYNLLYWEGEITLIDFPQAVNPYRNPQAYALFQRDMKRICEYFAAQGVQSDPNELAQRMWIPHDYSTESLYPEAYYQHAFADDDR